MSFADVTASEKCLCRGPKGSNDFGGHAYRKYNGWSRCRWRCIKKNRHHSRKYRNELHEKAWKESNNNRRGMWNS